MDEILTKLSRGYKVGSGGAAVAILCFFLPWVLVSCGGEPVRVSGWELATGTTPGGGYGAQASGDPLLFLVLAAGLGVLALAYRAYERGRATQADGYGLIGLGALPLAILLYRFSGLREQAASYGFVVEYQPGFWGVVGGYLVVIVGGILDLVELSKAVEGLSRRTPDIAYGDRHPAGSSIYSPTEPLPPPSERRSYGDQGAWRSPGVGPIQADEEPTDSGDEGYIWKRID